MHPDQRDSILITVASLMICAAIVYPQIVISGHGMDTLPILLAIAGSAMMLVIGWSRCRVVGADFAQNLERSASFSYWIGLAAVCLLAAFVGVANLAEDGLSDLALVGAVMVGSRVCLAAPMAWWVGLLMTNLMVWWHPADGGGRYLIAIVMTLAMSRCIPVLMEVSLKRRDARLVQVRSPVWRR